VGRPRRARLVGLSGTVVGRIVLRSNEYKRVVIWQDRIFLLDPDARETVFEEESDVLRVDQLEPADG
jgi:hypothetical protein